jgi:MFS transporter, DHA2 family, methylenomycin A resistance protein
MVVGQAIAGTGCLALLRLRPGDAYWAVAPQLVATGLGLLVPPLTSTLLGSVEERYSGVASAQACSTQCVRVVASWAAPCLVH